MRFSALVTTVMLAMTASTTLAYGYYHEVDNLATRSEILSEFTTRELVAEVQDRLERRGRDRPPSPGPAPAPRPRPKNN